jgi:hypothetical protein
MVRPIVAGKAAVLWLLVLAGCTGRQPTLLPDAGPAMGSPGGACYPNGTCNAGLACRLGRCERSGDGGAGADLRSDTTWVPPDGYGPLAPCAVPGQPCDAGDPCAINAVCGEDRRCHPSKVQNCDDGLACTRDSCKGLGLCENRPEPGFCVAGEPGEPPACVGAGSKRPTDPCLICDPGKNPLGWSPANGGACDDKDPCTMDDYCQGGVCKGKYFGDKCSDGLWCTDDKCDGKGNCLSATLSAGACLIDMACYKEGEQDPLGCGVCDTKKSTSQWTPLSTYCKVQGKCVKPGTTSPDGCGLCDPAKDPGGWTPLPPGSVCKILGTCWLAGAKHPAGCAECDPALDPAGWTVPGAFCLINNNCFKAGATDYTKCGVCDPAKSKTAWTTAPDACLISGQCYQAWMHHPTGPCAVCDPALSTSGWSVVSGCLVGNKCYTAGQLDLTGCNQCDPARSKTAWTPGAGVSTVSYGFEDGKTPPAGWTIKSSDTSVGWVVVSKRPGAGAYSLYYGNPTVWNYASGSTANQGQASLPAMTLTAGKKAALSFLLYMDTEAGSSFDTLTVAVNGSQVWAKGPGLQMKSWQNIIVDLSKWAGQSVTITFEFNTQDSIHNDTEGLFLDEVMVLHGC